MRVLGLDLGERRIGVAISDPLGITASGVEVIQRAGLDRDLARLSALIGENEVGEVVVGLPRHMNGSMGEAARKAQEFAAMLEARLEEMGLAPRFTFWDERLSTVAAQRALLEGDMSRAKRKQVVDKVAAAIILRAYLDSKPRA
ncbi:MAG: Holliday junction resolvase RuvX [Firmicutes bacterium]|nr:Holliday junction resolvase RuvX [Bacillota bacterium]